MPHQGVGSISSRGSWREKKSIVLVGVCLCFQTTIIVSYSCCLYNPNAVPKQTPTPTPSQENETEKESGKDLTVYIRTAGKAVRFGMLIPRKAVVYRRRESWLSIECLGYHVRREDSVKFRIAVILYSPVVVSNRRRGLTRARQYGCPYAQTGIWI